MLQRRNKSTVPVVIGLICITALTIFGDEKFESLFKGSKYKEAIEYAEANIPAPKRTLEVWLKLAEAYEKSKGAHERILYCYQSAQKVNPSEPRIYLGLGRANFKIKKYPEALKFYQRSYILNRTAEAAEGIATSAVKMENWDKARDAAESAINLDKNLYESRIILKEIYRKEKDFKGAAEQLEAIVKKKPTSLKFWLQLAMCYEKLGDKQALTHVDPEIIKLDKKNMKSRQRHAAYLMEAKKENSAFPIYKELAILTPDDPKVFKNLYQIALKKKIKKDAVLYLKNYLALDSTDAESHQTLADLMYSEKDFDGALGSYRKAIKLKRKIKGSYHKYIEIVLKKSLKKEAIRAIKGAISVGEANAKLYVALADIYKENKQYVEAAKMYNEALKTETKNIAILASYGECQAKSNNVTGAILTYEQVVLLNPKAITEYKTLGDLKIKSNKQKEGMASYKKYLEKKPDDYAIAKKIGLYEFDKKEYAEAIKYLEKVKSSKLQDEKYLFSLGLSYYRIKNYNKSAEVFSRARAAKVSVTTRRKFLKPLGESYEKIGNKKKAAEAYEAYTKLSGVKDADASYMGAYLREDSDVKTAITMYTANTKAFPKDHRNFLQLGLIYSKDKATTAKAVSMLNKASVLGANNPVIWKKLGEAYGQLKNETKELAAYKKLLSVEPQNLQANRRVGVILLKQKKYTEAITNLEMVSTMKPNDVEVMELLAEGYMKTKRPAKTVDLLTKAKKLKPNKVEIRTNLIKACEVAGKKELIGKEMAELIELDKKIVVKDKKNIESRVRLANYLYDKKDLAGAYPYYKELSILTPKDKSVFKKLYEIAIKTNKKNEGITYLKKYLALDPKNAKAHITLGKLLYENKKVDDALLSFRKAFQINSKIKGAYKEYGAIVVSKKLNNEAVKVLNALIILGEADVKTYISLGKIYQAKKQYSGAVKMFQKASDIDPKNSAVLASLGECQAKSGNHSAAILTYEQVILINPNAKKEYKALGDLQMKIKKKPEAIKTYVKYLEKEPTDNGVAKTVGLDKYSKKDYDGTIKYLEMVKDAKLQNTIYLKSLGNAYYQKKKYAKASEYFARAQKRKISVDVKKKILKPLAISYEKTGKKLLAANAYKAYAKLPGIKDADASYKMAFLREESSKKSAITMYESNIKLFPKDPRNFLRLGMIYSKDKSLRSKAASMLAKAANLKSNDPAILEDLGKIYFTLKRKTQELSTYKKLLKLQPQHLEANRRVGQLLVGKKQFSQAVINLEIVSAIEPNNLEIMLLLAECYIETKRHDNAIGLLSKAKKIKKNDVEIGRLLYKLYKETGKKRQAESEIKELIALTKDNKLRLIYAKDLYEDKRYDESVAIIKAVKANDPTNVDCLMLLGKVQQAQNKLSAATETYKLISYIKEDYVPALYERGIIYLKESKIPRATSQFKRIVESKPKSPYGYLGLAKVAKVQKKTALYTKQLNKAKALGPKNEDVLRELKKK